MRLHVGPFIQVLFTEAARKVSSNDAQGGSEGERSDRSAGVTAGGTTAFETICRIYSREFYVAHHVEIGQKPQKQIPTEPAIQSADWVLPSGLPLTDAKHLPKLDGEYRFSNPLHAQSAP